MTASSSSAVSFVNLGKSFFGVPVLRDVSFSVGVGRVLGLVGENGAGKSTLMNLLGGNLRPDEGRIILHGQPNSLRDPEDARRAGVAFVHQELNLFPNLSVAENLHLTSFPRRGPIIRRATMRHETAKLLSEVGFEIDPTTPVERLSAGERQLVEIAKALGSRPTVLILDEPTTSLSARECERLFRLVNELRGKEMAILYISHALGDVLRLCDDLVVLRDGQVVGQGPASDFDENQLVSLMVGRQIQQLYPRRQSRPNTKPILEARHLSQPGVARNVSFTLHAGEVLGLAGLMGAGRSELARSLFGLDPSREGFVLLDGQVLRGGPRSRVRAGMAFLTEDRRADGLCLEDGLAENMALVTLPKHARTPLRWLAPGAIGQAVRQMREAVRLTAKAVDTQPVKTLSGGNQQKVVLGKWLLAKPKVILLDEPTRGIDVGAKSEIYQLIHQLADGGAGALVISSEIEELIGICDRILVMRQGEITADVPRAEFDRERIMRAALPLARSA